MNFRISSTNCASRIFGGYGWKFSTRKKTTAEGEKKKEERKKRKKEENRKQKRKRKQVGRRRGHRAALGANYGSLHGRPSSDYTNFQLNFI